MNIALIGGTVEALLLALELSSTHQVYIIELEAEIGLPVRHPGRFLELDLLQNYFSDEHITFLCPQQNEDGWGCRWEWIGKHLAAKAARENITFLSRTRILSHHQHQQTHLLNLSTNERDFPPELEVQHVVLMSPNALQGPGKLQHNCVNDALKTYPIPPSTHWYGGTLPTASLPTGATADLLLSRGDGLTECWWLTSPTWQPPSGFIETCEVELPINLDEISFDASVQRAVSFAKHFV